MAEPKEVSPRFRISAKPQSNFTSHHSSVSVAEIDVSQYSVANTDIEKLIVSVTAKSEQHRSAQDLGLLYQSLLLCDYFAELHKEGRGNILLQMTKRLRSAVFQPNEVVYEQGSQAKYFYVLVSGALQQFQTSALVKQSVEKAQAGAGQAATAQAPGRQPKEAPLMYQSTVKKVIGSVRPGEFFGKTELLTNDLRHHGVQAKRQCLVVQLEKKDYVALFAQIEKLNREERVNKMKKTFYCMKNLNEKTCFHLVNFLEQKHFSLNQVVYRQGEIPDYIYFVLSGEFKVISDSQFEQPGENQDEPLDQDPIADQLKQRSKHNQTFKAQVTSPEADGAASQRE